MVEYQLKCSQSIESVMGVLVPCNEKVAFTIRLKRTAQTGLEVSEEETIFLKI